MKKRRVVDYSVGPDFIVFHTDDTKDAVVSFNPYQLDLIACELKDYGYSPSINALISEVEYAD